MHLHLNMTSRKKKGRVIENLSEGGILVEVLSHNLKIFLQNVLRKG